MAPEPMSIYVNSWQHLKSTAFSLLSNGCESMLVLIAMSIDFKNLLFFVGRCKPIDSLCSRSARSFSASSLLVETTNDMNRCYYVTLLVTIRYDSHYCEMMFPT